MKKIVRKIISSLTGRYAKSENAFYENLFIKNPYWNKTEPNPEEAKRWKIIEKFFRKIKKASSASDEYNILDLGCGRGWLSHKLTFFGKVTGIEPVRRVVAYAKKLFPDIEFICGRAEDLIAAGRVSTFDAIVCSEVIEHVPHAEQELFLLKIKNLLKPNGYLILTTPRKDAEDEWRKYGSPNQPIEDWLTEAEVQQLMDTTGMRCHSLEHFAIQPSLNAPLIEIYQLWLAEKV